MEPGSACPKCGYVRKATDAAPAWECPSCGIAVDKYRALHETKSAAREPTREEVEDQAARKSLADAEAMKQARLIAASNPLTAALVDNNQFDVLRPQLALERRLGMAAPDLVTAALFLWCWISPGAWRPTLATELGILMTMEFFVLHSSMFLNADASAPMGARAGMGLFVMLFYIPVAGGFAWWLGGWWPFAAFAWLLGSRVLTMLSGQGGDRWEAKRGRYYWGNAVGFYVLAIMVALFLPMPQLGFAHPEKYVWTTRISLPPHEVIAWGFFYFTGQAVMKILERPEWVAWGD